MAETLPCIFLICFDQEQPQIWIFTLPSRCLTTVCSLWLLACPWSVMCVWFSCACFFYVIPTSVQCLTVPNKWLSFVYWMTQITWYLRRMRVTSSEIFNRGLSGKLLFCWLQLMQNNTQKMKTRVTSVYLHIVFHSYGEYLFLTCWLFSGKGPETCFHHPGDLKLAYLQL